MAAAWPSASRASTFAVSLSEIRRKTTTPTATIGNTTMSTKNNVRRVRKLIALWQYARLADVAGRTDRPPEPGGRPADGVRLAGRRLRAGAQRPRHGQARRHPDGARSGPARRPRS